MALDLNDSGLWGSINLEETDLPESTLVDEIDEELFMLDDDEADADILDLDNDEIVNDAKLPSFKPSQDDKSSDDFLNRVSPEPSSPSSRKENRGFIRLPESSFEIDRQYQQTLKKLAQSMRQSDLTRSILKRHHSNDRDFFNSVRLTDIEHQRKKVRMLINC